METKLKTDYVVKGWILLDRVFSIGNESTEKNSCKPLDLISLIL